MNSSQCQDARHETPHPLPCDCCAEHCDPQEWVGIEEDYSMCNTREENAAELAREATKKKFVITETSRYEIEAESMEEAQRIWLNDLKLLADDTQELFIDVTERWIECITPDAEGYLEEAEEF